MDEMKHTVNREVLAGDGFAFAGGETAEETVEAHYAALEGFESPHGCIDGWVFLGWEDPETGEAAIERVPCKRCHS